MAARSRNHARYRAVALLLVGALVAGVGSTSWAQTVVLPRPEFVPDVPYPEGATGRAEVELSLVVDVDGSVRSAEVVRGSEPFAGAARAASRTWRFTPARRDGKPVAAKIRFAVTFEAATSPDPAPPDETDEPAPPAPSPSPPPPAIIDVTVEGEKTPPSVQRLTRAEVRALPGAFGDPFRAIEVLPGVTPIVSGLPFFYVRGAPPGNIGYYLDGVRVPYLFHVAAGPSVVNPALIDAVDLYSGGYPARFGRFAGAIVAAETTAPRPDWHGEAVLRLVDTGGFVEGGFADGRGTVALGGRYSYTAALLSALAPEVTLDYRDFQARVSFDVTPRDRLTVFAFGSFDFLATEQEPEDPEDEPVENVLFGQEFYRVDVRYDRTLDDDGFLRVAVTGGFDQTRLFGTRNSQNLLLGSRMRLRRPITNTMTVRAGFDVQLDRYTADPRAFTDPDNPDDDAFDELFPPRTDTAMAGWADLVWRPLDDVEIVPGLRLERYTSEGDIAWAIDPRLSVTTRVYPRVRVLHALGLATQPPSFAVPVPGFAVASLRGGLQRSLQASSGLAFDLPYKVSATVTGFAATFLNMTDAVGSQVDPTDPTLPRSLGGAKGLEVYVRRSLAKRFGGFVAYTLSRNTRSIGRERLLSTFDRTHVLNSAAGYDLGGGWKTGLRFSLFSGPPTAPTEDDDPPGTQRRDPAFYRFDFRAEKRWKLYPGAWIAFVAEMINITLNREVVGGETLPPITIPSLGLEASL
ncbi:MAG: TonB family protein [Myxococcota bacterium]